jgi:tubulin---tyrosine ligase
LKTTCGPILEVKVPQQIPSKIGLALLIPFEASTCPGSPSLIYREDLCLTISVHIAATDGLKLSTIIFCVYTLQATMATSAPSKFYAHIEYEDPYVQPLILNALRLRLSSDSYELVASLPEHSNAPLLQILQYESLAFERALTSPNKVLINSYIVRKALIRKHFLALTVANWVAKHPGSILARNVKLATEFELDYAEFLDEALCDAFELRDSLENNQNLSADQREWWILKPSMSDRGNGIRLLSTKDELNAIFEEWEEQEDSDLEEDSEFEKEDPEFEKESSDFEKDDSDFEKENPDFEKDDKTRKAVDSDKVITSQLRHFVAQPYIHPPLLLDSITKQKFHIRTYVIAVGALKVYVYRPMLALFAAKEYAPPWFDSDLKAHLTNTCLQGTAVKEGSVRLFWDFDDNVPSLESGWKERVFGQICEVTGDLFESAARNMSAHFQTLPCSFEIFGLDFLVDKGGTAWLLEVNAFPDFKQTGEDLKDLVQGLFEEVMAVAVKPFFKVSSYEQAVSSKRLVNVLDIDLGRR